VRLLNRQRVVRTPHAVDVTRLVAFLAASPDRWTPSRRLERAYAWTDRDVRLSAAASRGRILSGNAGYCLPLRATDAEVDHAIARLRSQARQMLRRCVQIRRARNMP